MSYNIDRIEILKSDGLRISKRKLNAINRKFRDMAPEIYFFDPDNWQDDPCDPVEFDNLEWYGEGSGGTSEIFEKLLAEFEGSADLAVIWEGGDSITGLRLRDGVVTDHEVKMELED